MRPVFSSFSTGYKIAWLFLCLLVGVITAGTITNLILMIPGVNNAGEVASIYVGSVMQSLLGTALPAYFVAAMVHTSPAGYLRMTDRDRIGEKLIFAVLAFMLSYVLASFLSQWNRGMELPASLSGVEQVLRSMEDAALETTDLLLSGKSIGSLVLNLVVVAGFAAVAEEMFFRGALQQFIQEKFPNGHAAVWIGAMVFSLVHFQFYGFLPRLLLGGLLGYLFLYTRNLWIPILFHFINNALIVIMHYFWGGSEWIQRLAEMPVNGWFVLAAVVSALCTFLLFWGYAKKSKKWESGKVKKVEG